MGLICPSSNSSMEPHANQNSNWRGAEGTWIYIKTQRPCSSQNEVLDEPWEQVTIGQHICLCGGSEDPSHGKNNQCGAFAYDLCASCEGKCTAPSLADSSLSRLCSCELKSELLRSWELQGYGTLSTQTHTHTRTVTLRNMHTYFIQTFTNSGNSCLESESSMGLSQLTPTSITEN